MRAFELGVEVVLRSGARTNLCIKQVLNKNEVFGQQAARREVVKL